MYGGLVGVMVGGVGGGGLGCIFVTVGVVIVIWCGFVVFWVVGDGGFKKLTYGSVVCYIGFFGVKRLFGKIGERCGR